MTFAEGYRSFHEAFSPSVAALGWKYKIKQGMMQELLTEKARLI